MLLKIDWKFWVVLAATLASVLVPVWLWKADLASRSLHFRQLSQTSLQPPDQAQPLDVKVTVAGAELTQPSLTVLELANDGARPISSTDFEGPLELFTSNDATIVRAAVSQARPKDLELRLSVEAGRSRISPLLVNPGDAITVAVIASGKSPVFDSRARIAGVSSVPVLDLDESGSSTWRVAAFLMLVSLLSFCAGQLVLDGWPFRGVVLRPRAAFLSFVVCLFPAVLALTVALDKLHITGFWPLVGTFVVFMLLSSIIASWLNGKTSKPSSSAPSGA